MPRGLAKRITRNDSSGVGMNARDERIGGIHHRHALEVDVGARELRADVVHVVVHAAQDHVGHRFGGVAARRLVAMQLLDPFQVDHRSHADQQVDVPRDVDLVGHDGAVQPFVEQQIRVRRQLLPLA